MRIQAVTAQRDEECAWCAYPFDAGDNAYIDGRNDDNVYCTTNCLTKHRCQISLAGVPRATVTARIVEPTHGCDYGDFDVLGGDV